MRRLSQTQLVQIDEAITRTRAAITAYEAIATSSGLDWAIRPAITHLIITLGALAEARATRRLSVDAQLTLQESAVFSENFLRRFGGLLSALQ